MKCTAALAGAALAAAALTPGAGWSETIKIPSHVDGGCCSISAGSDPQADPAPTGKGSDVSITVNEATSGHPEGGLDSLAIGAPPGPGAMAPAAAVGAIADPEPSTLTRLLIVISDLRDRVFGGP